MNINVTRSTVLYALGAIDPSYIAESEPTLTAKRKGRSVLLRVVLPAAAILLAAAALTVGIIAGRTENAPPAVTPGTQGETSAAGTQGDTPMSGTVVLRGNMSFRYDMQKNGYALLSLDGGGEGDCVIPEEVDGISVVAIDEDFALNEALSGALVIPKTVKTLPQTVIDHIPEYPVVFEDSPYFSYENGCLVDKINRALLRGVAGAVIPDDGSVISIAPYAFEGTELAGLSVPESVSLIGQEAFANCVRLERIDVGAGVTHVGDSAFENCTALKKVSLSDRVELIGSRAFAGCTALEEFVCEASSGFCLFGESVFEGCTALRNVVLPSNLATLPSGVFRNCTALRNVALSEAVFRIESGAFENCASLESLHTERTVERWRKVEIDPEGNVRLLSAAIVCKDGVIDNSAAEYLVEGGMTFRIDDAGAVLVSCKTVGQELVLPDEINGMPLIGIGDGVFADREELRRVVFGKNLESVGDSAFSGCAQITEVVFNDRLKVIGNYAFRGARSLKTAALPASLCAIGAHAFEECYELENPVFPESLLVIGDSAFSSCGSITALDFPESLTAIGEYAFRGTRVTELYLPENILFIGKGAFRGCDQLITAVLVCPIEELPADLFRHCSRLYSVTVPSSVRVIGENAFAELLSFVKLRFGGTREEFSRVRIAAGNGVLEKREVSCVDDPIETDADLFDYVILNDGNCYIAGRGSFCGESLTLPESYKGHRVIGVNGRAFADCTSLREVTVPPSVQYIGGGSFASCTSLERVILNEGLIKIWDAAFGNCTSLREIVIPKSVSELSMNVFGGCTALERVAIGGRIKEFELTFLNCSSLKEIVFLQAPASIGRGMFFGCTALETFEVPEGTKRICSDAFTDSGLRTVILPLSLRQIDADAIPLRDDLRVLYRGGAEEWRAVFEIEKIPERSLFFDYDPSKPLPDLRPLPDPEFAFYKTFDGSGYVFAGIGTVKDSEIVIPETHDGLPVKGIAPSAFYMDTTVKKVTVPGSLRDISAYAFSYSPALEEVCLEEGVAIIGNCAFQGCQSLKRVRLPSTLEMIDESAFPGGQILPVEIFYAGSEEQWNALTRGAFWTGEVIVHFGEAPL